MIINISSKKNEYIRRLKDNPDGEIICVGQKMLEEALLSNTEITSILWKEEAQYVECPEQYIATKDLFDYACPQVNSPGPVFTVRLDIRLPDKITNAIILENVQDPGNVGTVIRTANALGIDAVYLVGQCASFKNPKTVRSTMGAIFYEPVIVDNLPDLKIYGAALSDTAQDIRKLDLSSCAVAIGSEGKGLSREFLQKCDGELIIPMTEKAESLNAAVAATICMWQMTKL